MKQALVALVAFTSLVTAMPAYSQSAQRVSSADWVRNWFKSVEKNSKQQNSFNTAELEKKTLGSCSNCEDKKALTMARTLFAQGQFDQAIASYNEIPKGNSSWLNAVEEKGWAFFRKENYEKALAQTKTLLAPQFAEISNSEAFLLQSLTRLKICDYKGVFETHSIFKEKQKARIMAVQKLAQTGWNEALTKFLKKADKFPLTLDDMGDTVQELPLLIYKDLEFQKQALRFKASEKAIALAADNTSLKNTLEMANTKSFLALKKRVQQLAERETENNFKIIQKLNLVEVEAIQRVHTDLSLTDELYQKNNFQKVSDDQLVFMDDGKPWIDELDKFEVASKACIKGIRRKM